MIFELIMFLFVYGVAGNQWGYRNDHNEANVLPSKWSENFTNCNGTHQSPINIIASETVYDSSLKEINIMKINTHLSSSENWTIQNNGRSAELSSNKNYYIDLNGEVFEFLQMHFHWRGSEHSVNGQHFAGEIHLVHNSLNKTNSKAVISFFLRIAGIDNAQLKPLVESLQSIQNFEAMAVISGFNLDHLIPFKLSSYYRYNGSLTTPTCDEVVTWSVNDSPIIDISENQLIAFQSLTDTNGYQKKDFFKSEFGSGTFSFIRLSSSQNTKSTGSSQCIRYIPVHTEIIKTKIEQ